MEKSEVEAEVTACVTLSGNFGSSLFGFVPFFGLLRQQSGHGSPYRDAVAGRLPSGLVL